MGDSAVLASGEVMKSNVKSFQGSVLQRAAWGDERGTTL